MTLSLARFVVPPLAGERWWRSHQRGVSAASQSPECLPCHMTLKVNPVTLLASPLGEEGHEVAKGCTRVRMIMILDVDVTAERRHYNIHRPIGRYHNPRPERPSPPERSEHNPPPSGGHNPRDEVPSTLTPQACPQIKNRPSRWYPAHTHGSPWSQCRCFYFSGRILPAPTPVP